MFARSIISFAIVAGALTAQTRTGNPPSAPFLPQPLTDASGECKACHPRQYFEMKQAVHFGYRNVSPLFNGLELSGNFITGGLLRPVYHDSKKKLPDGTPLNTNMLSTPVFTSILQAQAGFCYTCHQALMERKGENPAQRAVPEIATGKDFRPDLIRPLRDYVMLDANGNQVLPLTPGGPTPTDAATCGVDGGCFGDPLATTGITCDSCHNVAGPDLNRSFQHDGFANMGMLLNDTLEKVGQFLYPLAPAGNFHIGSNDQAKINYLNSSASCNACHDVRIPLELPGDLQHKESNVNPGGSGVSYYRLENLSTEWQTGPLSGDNNPFGHAVKCQDCHTSLFPHNETMTYQVGDMTVTAAKPGVFPITFAAQPDVPFTCNDTRGQPFGVFCSEPSVGSAASYLNAEVTTDIQFSSNAKIPLQKRQVSSHYFTGVDVPLLSWAELTDRLGSDYSDPITGSTGINDDGTPGGLDVDPGGIICTLDTPCLNEFGQPRSMDIRRRDLLKNAVRIGLKQTDTSASLGNTFTVRVEAAALTGHRFPAGLSQERTTYIQLSVTDANGFQLYQSGYVVDKPHPETGETAPDTNLDDEDLEHVHASIDPGHHTDVYTPGPLTNGGFNELLEAGPDDGPAERVYAGAEEGLVLLRNELIRIFQPGEDIGRKDANGKPIIATTAHYEEVFSDDTNNTVDNYRSLPPFTPRTFRYKITLPSKEELAQMGVTIKGPLTVHAQINYEHFAPRLLRFITRTTGPDGPAGRDMGLMSEDQLDTFLRNITGIASADATVTLH